MLVANLPQVRLASVSMRRGRGGSAARAVPCGASTRTVSPSCCMKASLEQDTGGPVRVLEDAGLGRRIHGFGSRRAGHCIPRFPCEENCCCPAWKPNGRIWELKWSVWKFFFFFFLRIFCMICPLGYVMCVWNTDNVLDRPLTRRPSITRSN